MSANSVKEACGFGMSVKIGRLGKSLKEGGEGHIWLGGEYQKATVAFLLRFLTAPHPDRIQILSDQAVICLDQGCASKIKL